MGFYILKSDLNDLGSSFTDYTQNVSEKFGNVGTSITSLSQLSSFSGTAATSIKSYFSEVHLPLASSIAELAEQLCSDYFAKYLDKYSGEPILENDWAKLSEEELNAKKEWVSGLQTNYWYETDSQLANAIAALPGDVSLSKPNTHASKAELTKLESSLSQLVDNVRSVEQTGKNAFAADATEFSRLLNAIESAISQCKYDMTSYQAGAFNAVLESTGLREAFNASLQDCEANAEKMIQNQEIMYGELYQREALRLAEEQKVYDTLGIILGVGLVIVGVAATVATAGVATPGLLVAVSVAGGLSASAGTMDVINRTKTAAKRDERIKNLSSGRIDALADEGVESLGDAASVAEAALGAQGTSFSKSEWKASGYAAVGGVTALGVDSLLEDYKDESSFAQSMTMSAMQEGVGIVADPATAKIATGAKFSVSKLDATSAVLGLAQSATDFKSNELEDKIVENQEWYQKGIAKLGQPSFAQRNAWATAW